MLRYRLTPYHHPAELDDAQRAIRIVRSRAREFGIQPDRIGMMGFSAGGHLAATAGTHYDAGKADDADPVERVSSRPDFLILCLSGDFVSEERCGGQHSRLNYGGSGRNLLGENPDQKTLDDLSDELHVTEQTPPAFLYHTSNDSGVAVQNSVAFYLALRKAHVPAEIHLYESGPHGSGMGMLYPGLGTWPTLLMNWMQQRGLLTAVGGAGGRGASGAASPSR